MLTISPADSRRLVARIGVNCVASTEMMATQLNQLTYLLARCSSLAGGIMFCIASLDDCAALAEQPCSVAFNASNAVSSPVHL